VDDAGASLELLGGAVAVEAACCEASHRARGSESSQRCRYRPVCASRGRRTRRIPRIALGEWYDRSRGNQQVA